MTIELDNVSGAEFDPGTGASTPYKAPDVATTTSQQAAIDALNAAVLSLANSIRTITATATLTLADKTVLANATSGAIIVNLPAVTSNIGQIITVKKIDAGGNAVTITPHGAELIDGAATKALLTQWSSLTFQSNGSAWYVI